MVALTKAEDARTRRAQAGRDISRLTEEPNNGIDPGQPVNFEFEQKLRNIAKKLNKSNFHGNGLLLPDEPIVLGASSPRPQPSV